MSALRARYVNFLQERPGMAMFHILQDGVSLLCRFIACNIPSIYYSFFFYRIFSAAHSPRVISSFQYLTQLSWFVDCVNALYIPCPAGGVSVDIYYNTSLCNIVRFSSQTYFPVE